jgi:hypothetical protein
MDVRLTALCVGRALPPEIFYGTHFCYRLNIPQGLVRLEGLGKLGGGGNSHGNELATFQSVA